MNILFYTTSRVSEQKGGTERITARITEGLRKLGHKCYSAYKCDVPSEFPINPCDGEINVCQAALFGFIEKNNINVIIVQKITREVIKIKKFLVSRNINCKILSVLHFSPGYEEKALKWSNFLNSLSLHQSKMELLKNIVRSLVYPVYKCFYPFRNKQLYKTVYEHSDYVVLLSNHFVSEYQQYAGIADNHKFRIIPNALSFNESLSFADLEKKKKQVLIVSRLDETLKRLSLAFQVWKLIEKDNNFQDWKLKIVGHGKDYDFYRKMVSDMKMKHVDFCGRQNPLPYYKESSIFLMTSSSEGWGLTLTEAQQFGCVPIAFNTFSSLSDIIQNGKNGFIIEPDNISKYVETVKLLMNDSPLRSEVAKNAINSSSKYELSSIIKKWNQLLLEK